jgi:hypothetical protein
MGVRVSSLRAGGLAAAGTVAAGVTWVLSPRRPARRVAPGSATTFVAAAESVNYVIPPDIPEGMTLAEYRRQNELTPRAHAPTARRPGGRAPYVHPAPTPKPR